MSGITRVSNLFNWACGMGRKQIEENRNLALTMLVVSTAFATIALAYRRLQSPQTIPFDRRNVSLGLSSQTSLTSEEVRDLAQSSQTYSPVEFARRLHAYVSDKKNQTNSLGFDPKTPQEWLDWMCSSTNEIMIQKAHPILPSFKESFPITQEDEKAHTIQTWAMSLQPLFALIKENPLPWKELLQPIQSSPRLAYTILFNCIAPFAAKAAWDGVHNFLPSSIQEMGSRYLEHKGKIALACLGLIVWLYYRMNQEKGIITNLTENFASSHKVHKGLDLIPCYREGIDKLFRNIGMSTPKQPRANIIWYYNKNAHSTFVGAIGEILGEMTATGRIYENSSLLSEFPQLKNLKIVELNLHLFLTEYRDKDEVYRGWHEVLKDLAKSTNTLVVLTGIDAIKPFLLPSQQDAQKSSERSSESSNASKHEKSPGKILADLLLISLQQGDFRCLIELNEQDKIRMEKDMAKNGLFSAIRAPDINAEELEKLCERLYTAPDVSFSLDKSDINNLFNHLKSALSKQLLPPFEIMDTIQSALTEQASSWRLKAKDQETIRKIEKAERQLYEVQQMKDHLLQKLWHQRRLQEKEHLPLIQGLLLIENILLPLYKKVVVGLKNKLLTPPDLVARMQKRFVRMFGPCTAEEEERLKMLPGKLKKSIQGQDLAIKTIAEAVYSWRKIPSLDGKPLVLFFAGAPGIGKSQTATEFAHELNSTYGIEETAVKSHESNVKRINLNSNAPGGFTGGWDKIKAEILSCLLLAPTSVIILEEWDKMEDSKKSCLLELLEGTKCYMQEPWGYSSTNGPFVDKSSAIFILTANIGPGEVAGQAEETVKKGIFACFPKEKEADAKAFLSRIDAVVPFLPISEAHAQNLIKGYLDEYVRSGILSVDKRVAVEKSLEKRDNSEIDARALQSIVRKAIFEAIKD